MNKKIESNTTIETSATSATREKVLYNQALTFYWLEEGETEQAEHYLRKTIKLRNEAKENGNI